MVAALSACGNPSSVHQEGRDARRHLEDARRRLAAIIGVAPASVVLLSSATEANNLVLRQSRTPPLVSAIEHPSVLASANGRTVPVDPRGRVDLDALDSALRHQPAEIVSIMLANNEIGVLQPIAEAAAIAHAHGARLHVDAVQALGRHPLDGLDADFLTLSAHKIGGPKGCGALIIAEGTHLAPLLCGGGQERGQRAGTENVAGALGFAAALDDMPEDERQRLERLRDSFEDELLRRCPAATVIAREAPRIAHISAICLPGCRAETMVMRLDLEGIAVSAGAACSSGKVSASHVLSAIGLAPDQVASTIRASFGWSSTVDELERTIDAICRAYRALA